MWERNVLYKELKALQIIPNTSFEYEDLSLNSESGWWSVNRLLKKGSSGADVLRLQKALKDNLSNLDLDLTSRYDEKTVKAVKKFQKTWDLVEDGIAGPFTQAIIFESNYSWALPKPLKVKQNAATCWAAAYQSALPLWKGRPKMTVAQLLNYFKRFTDSSGAIDKRGLYATAMKFNASIRQADPTFFNIETIKRLLLETKSPFLLLHYMFGDIGHAEVVFGFEVEKGVPLLWVMDPLLGDYKKLALDDLKTLVNPIFSDDHKTLVNPIFLVSPN